MPGTKSELKSCPFCGGEARRGENKDFGHLVYCKKCLARTTFYKSKGAAARAWNRRHKQGLFEDNSI